VIVWRDERFQPLSQGGKNRCQHSCSRSENRRNRWKVDGANYLPVRALGAGSKTSRQAVLSCSLRSLKQDSTLAATGMYWPHRRNASGLHTSCWSGVPLFSAAEVAPEQTRQITTTSIEARGVDKSVTVSCSSRRDQSHFSIKPISPGTPPEKSTT
jgi:hypothetical protein